jgi:hypothetical protein
VADPQTALANTREIYVAQGSRLLGSVQIGDLAV